MPMVSRSKIFLVVIASIASLALLGAATASATKLCTDKTCSALSVYWSGTPVNLSLKSGTTTQLKTSGGTALDTCTGSTIAGKTSNESGATVSLTVESLTWSGCSKTTDTITNGSLLIAWTSGSNGEVTGKSSQVTANTIFGSCTYGFGESTKLGTLTGGEEPLLLVNTNLAKTAGSAFCPSTAIWTAEYVVTEPHALFVGEGEAPAPPEWEWHVEGQQLASVTESETIKGSGGAVTLATTIGESSASISCESAELTSATITPEGKGGSTIALSKGCQVVGQPTCAVAEPISLKANTEPLTSASTSQLFNRYVPAESKFATVKISGCGFAGEYAVEGSFAGEFEAGEERIEEPIIFTPKIEEEAGTSLKFGGKAATLEGKIAIAASGAFAGQKVAASPIATSPRFGPLFGKGVEVGKSETKIITHKVLAKKGAPGVKFGTVSIIGSAGVLSIEKEDCSGKTKAPGETCTITVKFAPKAKEVYKASILTPFESPDGKRFSALNTSLEETGT